MVDVVLGGGMDPHTAVVVAFVADIADIEDVRCNCCNADCGDYCDVDGDGDGDVDVDVDGADGANCVYIPARSNMSCRYRCQVDRRMAV